MYKKFVENLYKAIIEDGSSVYAELFETTELDSDTIDYWKDAVIFYNKLDLEQKSFLKIMLKQVMIDTVSGVFGIIDGSSSIDGDYEIDITINGEKNECELQDSFLEYVEELNDIEKS